MTKTLQNGNFARIAHDQGVDTSTAEREIRLRLVERVLRCLVTAEWFEPFGLTSVMPNNLQ
jgi:hypothetical protein